jgi:hypothetical protein
MNPEIETRITEITEAIHNLCLGSIESAVTQGAVDELLANWGDHEK